MAAKARDLAHRLARRENRSIADVVERALESYEIRQAGREPASAFHARITSAYGSDIDLEALVRENRQVLQDLSSDFPRYQRDFRNAEEITGSCRHYLARPP